MSGIDIDGDAWHPRGKGADGVRDALFVVGNHLRGASIRALVRDHVAQGVRLDDKRNRNAAVLLEDLNEFLDVLLLVFAECRRGARNRIGDLTVARLGIAISIW